MIGEKRLREIEAIETQATPGPWFVSEAEYSSGKDTLVGNDADADGFSLGSWTVSTDTDNAGWNTDGGYPGYAPSRANLAFMAMARQAIPELVAEIRRLQGKS